MNIGIDIDGVLTNLEEFYREYVCKYRYNHNIETSIDISKYWIKDAYGLDKNQDNDFFTNYFKYYEDNWKARAFASEVIEKLKNDGNKIYIITSRWKTGNNDEEGTFLKNKVLKWLKDNDIYYDDIFFVGWDKLNKLKDLKIDVMIEDHPDNILSFSKVTKVICFDASYNKNCNGENIIRCYSWYDIYSKIIKMK